MSNFIGMRFGRLTVISFEYYKNRQSRWKCLCDCGKETIVRQDHLKDGSTKSCGCFRREEQSHKAKKHGQKGTRLYGIWNNMKFRCENPNAESYKDYGGRGIKVCTEWEHDFESFYKWAMNNGYADNLTIDRIDVNGNYEPSNCRWATIFVQSNNKRNTRFLTFNGQTKSIREWSIITGIKSCTLADRVFRLGWSVEQALTLPKSQGKRVKK